MYRKKIMKNKKKSPNNKTKFKFLNLFFYKNFDRRIFSDEIVNRKVYKFNKKINYKNIKNYHYLAVFIFPIIFILLFSLSIVGLILNFNQVNSTIVSFSNNQNTANFITIVPNVQKVVTKAVSNGNINIGDDKHKTTSS